MAFRGTPVAQSRACIWSLREFDRILDKTLDLEKRTHYRWTSKWCYRLSTEPSHQVNVHNNNGPGGEKNRGVELHFADQLPFGLALWNSRFSNNFIKHWRSPYDAFCIVQASRPQQSGCFISLSAAEGPRGGWLQ